MMAQIDIDSGWSNINGDQIRQIPSRAIVNNTLICESRDLKDNAGMLVASDVVGYFWSLLTGQVMTPTPNLSFPCATKNWRLLEDAAGRRTQNLSLSLIGQRNVSSMIVTIPAATKAAMMFSGYLLVDTRL